MIDPVIDTKVGELEFLMYDDENQVYVRDRKSPYEHGIEIPLIQLIEFRDALSQIIEEQGNTIDRGEL